MEEVMMLLEVSLQEEVTMLLEGVTMLQEGSLPEEVVLMLEEVPPLEEVRPLEEVLLLQGDALLMEEVSLQEEVTMLVEKGLLMGVALMRLLQADLAVHTPADAKSDQPDPPPPSPSAPLHLPFLPSPLLPPSAPARLPLQGACARGGKGRRAVKPARRDGRVAGDRERERGLGGSRTRTRSTGRTREDCNCGTRRPRTLTTLPRHSPLARPRLKEPLITYRTGSWLGRQWSASRITPRAPPS